MKIIGLDPGTATTGYSILENINGNMRLLDYGCIRTAAGLGIEVRLDQIADDLKTIVKKWEPQHASVEKIYFQKNTKTAIDVAQARGVMVQKLTEFGVNFHEYTPLEVKMSVCAYGKADKKMVQQMVKMILRLQETPKPDDAADAIALAICLANSLSLKERIKQ
jgi:crossover junction endodeoxyribonuclease RuvC